MKRQSLSWFLTILVVSIGLTLSCGKDNATDSDITSSNDSTPVVTNITGTPTPSETIDIFIQNILDGNFKTPTSTTETYIFVNKSFSTTSAQANFSFYCNIPYICNSNSSSGSSTLDTFQRQLNGSSVDRDATDDTEFSSTLTTLKTELASLVSQAKANTSIKCNIYYGCYQEYHYERRGTNSYAIYVGDSYYIIDLDRPLAANPVYKQNQTTKKIYELIQTF